MAQNPQRVRNFTFDVDRVLSRNNRIVARTMRRLAVEMEAYTVDQVTQKQSPPRSEPGQYPHRDSGKFSESLHFIPRGRSIVIQTTNVGRWLETGTRARAKSPSSLPIPVGRGGVRREHRKRSKGPGGMKPRPWMTLAIFRQKDRWFRRASEIAREESAKD